MYVKQIVRDSARLNSISISIQKPTKLPVYKDYLPPCNQSCPTGNDIQDFLALVREFEFKKAWQKLVINQPMPAIHGRVCYHPCELSCNRIHSDSPVSIQQVERMLGDLALDQHWSYPIIAEQTKNKVLINRCWQVEWSRFRCLSFTLSGTSSRNNVTRILKLEE